MNPEPSPSIFTRPDGRELDPRHHLDTHRGKYRLRITIDQGGKFVGLRICQPLRTSDPDLAGLLRDVAVEALARAGCLTRDIVLTAEPEAGEVDAISLPSEFSNESRLSPIE